MDVVLLDEREGDQQHRRRSRPIHAVPSACRASALRRLTGRSADVVEAEEAAAEDVVAVGVPRLSTT